MKIHRVIFKVIRWFLIYSPLKSVLSRFQWMIIIWGKREREREIRDRWRWRCPDWPLFNFHSQIYRMNNNTILSLSLFLIVINSFIDIVQWFERFSLLFSSILSDNRLSSFQRFHSTMMINLSFHFFDIHHITSHHCLSSKRERKKETHSNPDVPPHPRWSPYPFDSIDFFRKLCSSIHWYIQIQMKINRQERKIIPLFDEFFLKREDRPIDHWTNLQE